MQQHTQISTLIRKSYKPITLNISDYYLWSTWITPTLIKKRNIIKKCKKVRALCDLFIFLNEDGIKEQIQYV